MSQIIQVYKNTTSGSSTFGKYYVRPVYDDIFITTDDLADFIQMQASVKRSDCKAVLDELGSAFKSETCPKEGQVPSSCPVQYALYSLK